MMVAEVNVRILLVSGRTVELPDLFEFTQVKGEV